jgi:hypothetical protein
MVEKIRRRIKMKIIDAIKTFFSFVFLLGWIPSLILWHLRYGNIPLNLFASLPLLAVAWLVLNIFWAIIACILIALAVLVNISP